MKLIWYECKKIWNIKTILFLSAFTFLFYQLFLWSIRHPDDSASCDGADDLVAILQEEYGYDTFLPYEDFDVLEEIRLKQVEELDQLVLESEDLQAAGITSWESLREIAWTELSSRGLFSAFHEIEFEKGIRQVFVVQTIDEFYAIMKHRPVMGIEDGKEFEAAKIFQSRNGIQQASDCAIGRIVKYMQKNQLSLLPFEVTDHVSMDFPKIGILMIISCMVFILPYQIRERLAGVVPLHKTTLTGRSLWKSQIGAVICSVLIICFAQLLVFGVVLWNAGMLQYFDFSMNGTGWPYYWLDMTFGTYLLINGVFCTLIALCCSIIFFVLSRSASNYIVGIGMGLPVAIVLGAATYFCMKYFLVIRHGYSDFIPYLGWLVLLCVFAGFICFMINKKEQRSDVLL